MKVCACRNEKKTPLFLNTKQSSSSGKFLEMETVSVAVTASHSYPNSLAGCPLEFFLCSMISELNFNEEYQTFSGIQNMPEGYKAILIGLLSPANANWRDESSSEVTLQNETIIMGSYIWSNNLGRNDGVIPLLPLAGAAVKAKGSFEAKCYQAKVPTDELVKTMKNTILNKHLVTVLVVTDFGEITSFNSGFNDAKEKANVYIIRGNADRTRMVATSLKFEPIHVQKDFSKIAIPTVIMINLNSIYYNRYSVMKSVYQST